MSKKTVLLVDDSDLVAGIVGEALEEAGFTVERAVNGLDGIQKAYALMPDLIVMDVEMPVIKGYQASRLLKKRRGVKDIPIIMHTSCSEDKDRFWAYTAGINAFVTKDFDNMENLVQIVKKLSADASINRDAIREDAKRMDTATIIEQLSNYLDDELLQATIINKLGETARSISSPAETIRSILDLVNMVCERHIALLFVCHNTEVLSYISPSQNVFESDVDDFYAVSMDDFFNTFDQSRFKPGKKTVFGIEARTDYTKIRLDKERVSSYVSFPLVGKGGASIGTLHLGHLRNNYFSEAVLSSLEVFVREAGIIIENSLLVQHVTEMESDIRFVFSKFVPAEIINDLVARKSTATMLAGEKRNVTVLFSDIRAFTSISETNPPEVVVAFLNRYLEQMCAIIEANGGTIDKFIGDAVLAVFGVPKSYVDNNDRAVRSAIQMQNSLSGIDIGALKLPKEGFKIGIGIHSGDAIVGSIGSQTKQEYTVIGDTVNVASRLESLTKHYQLPIIISQAVASGLDESILLREIDAVQVKGKDQSTAFFSVELPSYGFFTQEDAADYKKALAMYRIKNWSSAEGFFKAVFQRRPDDPVCVMYLERCKNFIENPPSEEWTFVERYISK